MTVHDAVTQYVAYKRSIGMVFRTDEQNLTAFSKAIGRQTELGKIAEQKVRAFISGGGPITTHIVRKHATLRGFYDFAIQRGYGFRSPVPDHAPKVAQAFKPHIYSCGEIRYLLKGIQTYQRYTAKLERHTFRTVLLLLYGAALRVSEAIALDLADVDLNGALLTVRFTKFGKSRLVPLGPQLQKVMEEYAKARRKAGHQEDPEAPFFILRDGSRLNYALLQDAFQRLRSHVHLRPREGEHHQPRLHDLRHAFAVHRLTTWYRQGADVQRLLPALATFLGHCEIASTQPYLTMTPELLCEALQRFERYAQKGGAR